MVDLNMSPEGSQEGSNIEDSNDGMMQVDVESHEGSAIRDPTMDPYQVNSDDDKDAEVEPIEIPDEKEEKEINYYSDTQIALTHLAIVRPYDHLDHFFTLNFETMTSDCLFSQGGSENDPTNEFEIRQQYENKEEVIIAVKTYSIRRAVKYKILENDQLKYDIQYIQFEFGCQWNGIAQHIFTIVKVDPTINLRVLQGGVENHFGYKASYRKVWLVKQIIIARIYGDWEESYNKLPHWLFAM
ncbi:hypothetical protein Ahy_B06g084815 [Arachis hypogaea]|uniref:Transposase MuDR plant domain-containing protein n=1 Tax=Arachis hypogaea TaxID=3818 RepID=A0A444YST8_ARAHY|nr:hypothetical protein Ahy_B06g084815 [Arachis hypogaea]